MIARDIACISSNVWFSIIILSDGAYSIIWRTLSRKFYLNKDELNTVSKSYLFLSFLPLNVDKLEK